MRWSGCATRDGPMVSRRRRLAAQPIVQIAVPRHGPADIAGIPIADTLLEQLWANATIELVVVDDDGVVLGIGRPISVLSSKLRRTVLLGDGRCRVPGCGGRTGTRGPPPRPPQLAGNRRDRQPPPVCPAHHRLLVPNGLLALVGNP